MGVSVKNNRTIVAIYLLSVLLLNIKSCSVSMMEPFSSISFNELWWQLVIPAGVIGSLIVFIYFLIYSVSKKNWKGKLSLGVLGFLLLSSEMLNVYGYLWDLKYHAKIPQVLTSSEFENEDK